MVTISVYKVEKGLRLWCVIYLESNYVKKAHKPEPINLKLILKIFIIRTEGFIIRILIRFHSS